MTGSDPRRFVFLDETGAKTNMTRAFARSRKGERAVDYAPHGHWNTTTLIAGITRESAMAPMVLDGPMDTAAFEAYLKHIRIPELPTGSIVDMDSLYRAIAGALSTISSNDTRGFFGAASYL